MKNYKIGDRILFSTNRQGKDGHKFELESGTIIKILNEPFDYEVWLDKEWGNLTNDIMEYNGFYRFEIYENEIKEKMVWSAFDMSRICLREYTKNEH